MKWKVRDIDASSNATKTSQKPTKPKNRKRKMKQEPVQQMVFDEATTVEDLDRWTWNQIEFPATMPITDESAGGFTLLDEIDGVDVSFETTDEGRVAKFRKLVSDAGKESKSASKKNASKKSTPETPKPAHPAEVLSNADELQATTSEKEIDMSAWECMNLNESLLANLKRLKFSEPTEIQAQSIPRAICEYRDIIGAAETGSGKTLAFSLPILNWIMLEPEKAETGMIGLVLTPTRELALQVRQHMQSVAEGTGIRIMAIVGGMSIQKQKRLISKRPHIIIATPGRFWSWISEGDEVEFFCQMHKTLKFLVLDEADRMIEKGHYKDLDSIVGVLKPKTLFEEWNNAGELEVAPQPIAVSQKVTKPLCSRPH